MTTVITNKIGLDIVDIEVEQTGEAETDMFFQEPVLDASKDYVVGVSELTVPLSAEQMLTNNSTIINGVLLEFKRKQLMGVTFSLFPRGSPPAAWSHLAGAGG